MYLIYKIFCLFVGNNVVHVHGRYISVFERLPKIYGNWESPPNECVFDWGKGWCLFLPKKKGLTSVSKGCLKLRSVRTDVEFIPDLLCLTICNVSYSSVKKVHAFGWIENKVKTVYLFYIGSSWLLLSFDLVFILHCSSEPPWMCIWIENKVKTQ